ncbi:hypothetical protein [uncultured Fusobacterium sp.]|uniref:hypothetical protein n=1 Tax=uncultured Fusobacterium sp. TaxID=159267 RepID=UPI0025DC217C|nr:hypothetical protein [uncultured Fusobacterium sp.]
MKADRHPELLGSNYKMTVVNKEIFWNLILLLQKQLKDKSNKNPVSKIDTLDYVNSKIEIKELKNLNYKNISDTIIEKAVKAIYNTDFAFRNENFSKTHKLFNKLEISEDFEYITVEIKVGYRYLFYPSNSFLTKLEKTFRRQIKAKENSKADSTYRSTRTKARNFITKDITLEDLKEFKKIVDERMVELKEAKRESEKNFQIQ